MEHQFGAIEKGFIHQLNPKAELLNLGDINIKSVLFLMDIKILDSLSSNQILCIGLNNLDSKFFLFFFSF